MSIHKDLYPLQALLSIRDHQLKNILTHRKLASKKLKEHNSILKHEQKTLINMNMIHRRRIYNFTQKSEEDQLCPIQQRNIRTYIQKLRVREVHQQVRIDMQHRLIEDAAKELQQYQRAFALATRALKILEQHKKNWLKNKRRTQATKEEQIYDEISQVIYRK